MEVCGSGSLDAATNLIGVTNQSLSCPSFCHGGQGRAQAVLQQCLADAAAARERCRTILSRWTIGVSCLPYEGIVFSPWGIFSPVSVHHQPGGSGQQPGVQVQVGASARGVLSPRRWEKIRSPHMEDHRVNRIPLVSTWTR